MAKQKDTFRYPIFGFSIFFVKDPPPYLQQGGHKMTIILYVYISIYREVRGSSFIYIYIYKITVILWPPCWKYEGGSFTQKDRESKNRVHMFFYAIFWAVWFSCNLELLYIKVYIYIAAVLLRPLSWCYRCGLWAVMGLK